MSRPIIEVDGLSKLYRLGSTIRHDTLRDAIAHGFGVLTGRAAKKTGKNTDEPESIWALKDVRFNVHEGEVLGIIGRNGAGKSTLLKILSRITDPTEGTARMRGRVASLLEVGTGFHPELTGGENIYLNGAILGMRRSEVRSKFDEIVDFAEVEKFLDTPVKRYSSGMYVRLAFAVAAHLDPEILIVDEVLAVGDAAFQKKCLGKMNDVSKSGRTVLMVSHNMASIKQLCSTCLMFEQGQVVKSGPVREVTEHYFGQLQGGSCAEHRWDNQDGPGDDTVRLRKVSLCTSNGEPRSEFGSDEDIFVEVEYRVLERQPYFKFGFSLFSNDGTYVFYSADEDMPEYAGQPREKGDYVSRCRIPSCWLNTGAYHVVISGGLFGIKTVVQNVPALALKVIASGGPTGRFGGQRMGVLAPVLEWKIERL